MSDDVFIFALCSPDKRFPQHRDWYLKIENENKHQISIAFDSLISLLELKFGHNPHYFKVDTKEPVSDMCMIFHPYILGAYWLNNIIELLIKFGVVYISINGSFFPPVPDSFVEYSTISSPVLSFPTIDIKESIMVTQWKDGSHFYLESSINRIFPSSKYHSFDSAYQEALKYVDPSKIIVDKYKR